MVTSSDASSFRTLLAATAAGLLAATATASGPGPSSLEQQADLLRAADEGAAAALRSLARGSDPCTQTADLLVQAGIRGLQEDLLIAFGNCLNTTGPKLQCIAEAYEAFFEGLDEVAEQHEARIELCELLGGGPYDPDVDPRRFVDEITNPLLPYAVGSTWTYHKLGEDGLEVVVVTVTDRTKEILGVECTVVRDTVTIDGELVEDTDDYFAQDDAGNVWYFGEISKNYEDGELADIEGSWEAGEDGAKPGIVMFASPVLGTTYRQEFLLDEAEDAATVASLDETVTVPFGSFLGCLQTEDFTPLEPDTLEYKYFAPGVGLVLEVDPESGERLELIDFQAGS